MNHPKNILVITYWSFSDALIQTYTLPYLEIILQQLPPESKIFLVTLETNKQLVTDAYCSPNIINIKFNYAAFGLSAFLKWLKNIFLLRHLIKKNNINFIHTFCTPAGMFGYILSKLTGTPLILDSFEPHAEAMVENGEWQQNSLSFKLLYYFEKKQTKRALKVIGTTDQMRNYAFEKYNINIKSFYSKPACVDLEKFNLSLKKDNNLIHELNLNNKVVGVYAGKFGGIYLKEEVFEFYGVCYKTWGDNFVALILTNHPISEINALIEKQALPKTIFRILFVPHAQINKYIGLGDFAITPVKPVNTKKYCTPIKNGEYWAMGLPIVITRNISVDSDIIERNNIGYVLKEHTNSEYIRACEKIVELLKDKTLSLKIRQVAETERNFNIAIKVYKAIYG